MKCYPFRDAFKRAFVVSALRAQKVRLRLIKKGIIVPRGA